jgi:hypothetical protein
MITRASLRYYAGTNTLVVLGVAVAVAVLSGALLVGESVRESLRQLALGRLGRVDTIVTSPMFFRSALASSGSAPIIIAAGAARDAWRSTASTTSSGSSTVSAASPSQGATR